MEGWFVAECLDVSARTGWVKRTGPEVLLVAEDPRVGSRRCWPLAPWPWQVPQAQRSPPQLTLSYSFIVN